MARTKNNKYDVQTTASDMNHGVKDLYGGVPCQDRNHLISDAIFVIGDRLAQVILFLYLSSIFNQHIVPIIANQNMPRRIIPRSKDIEAPTEGPAVATGALRANHRLASFQALSLD